MFVLALFTPKADADSGDGAGGDLGDLAAGEDVRWGDGHGLAQIVGAADLYGWSEGSNDTKPQR